MHLAYRKHAGVTEPGDTTHTESTFNVHGSAPKNNPIKTTVDSNSLDIYTICYSGSLDPWNMTNRGQC